MNLTDSWSSAAVFGDAWQAASLAAFGMLQNMDVGRMKKGKLFFIILLGILTVVSASWAQTGSRFEEVANSREADSPVVNVYGPAVLTDLAAQAIQEKRPDVVIVQQDKPLKNKVLIEGTTGTGYMPLSPKRVGLLQAAKARGGSVYSALCGEQKGVIKKTVGMKKVVANRVEWKEYRTETRKNYVQPVYPPPPAVYVSPVSVVYSLGGYYPFYGYRGYGGYPYYRGWRGYRSFHSANRGHFSSGSFHRGDR